MADHRKRRLSDMSAGHGSKRQSLVGKEKDSREEEEDEDDESDFAGIETLLNFQKRRLVEKISYLEKVKLKEKDEAVKKLESWRDQAYATVCRLGSCWDELMQDLSVMVSRLEKESVSTTILEEAGTRPGEGLQLFLDGLNSPNQGDDNTKERVGRARQLTSTLVESLNKAHRANDALYDRVRTMAGGSNATLKELQTDNGEMHRDRTHLEDQLLVLQSNMATQSRKATELEQQAEAAKSRANQLAEDLKYTELRNEILDQKVRKLRQQLVDAESQVKSAQATATTSAQSNANSTTDKLSTAAQDNATQQELADMKKICQSRAKELETLREERAKDRAELDRLRSTFVDPLEAPQYKVLQTQYAVALKEMLEARAVAEAAQKEANTVLASRRAELDSLEEVDRDYKAKVETEVRQAESRLQALTNERDSLQLQLKAVPPNAYQDGLVTEMKQLIVDLQNHNSRQKNEIRRQKQRLDELIAKENMASSLSDLRNDERRNQSRAKESELMESSANLEDLRRLCRTLRSERDMLVERLTSTQRNAPNASSAGKHDDSRNELMLRDLQGKLQSKDQEEAALMAEMEVIGQAYEALQEQNARLQGQLLQKEDTNLNLLSQQIKSTQINQLLKEEREAMETKITALQTLCDTTTSSLRKLEEKEKNLRDQLGAVEKESWLRQQAMEMHRRKAIDTVQEAKEKAILLDQAVQQKEELSKLLGVKTELAEKEQHQRKRLEEELYLAENRLKRVKMAADSPTALFEEEIRQYKEMVDCSLCKRRRKNGIITKCFHSFCLQCIQERYDNRMRKCPTCLDPFGQSDIHQIYL